MNNLSFKKALIVVLAGSFPAILLANYALIFFEKSAFASWMSVILVVAGFLGRWKKSEKADLFAPVIFTGLALYALYPAYIVLVLAFSFLARRKIKTEALTGLNEFKNWMICSAGYLLMDVLREYTVWKELRLRLLPACIFLIILFINVYFIRQQGRSADQ